jgi:hypothetical protein
MYSLLYGFHFRIAATCMQSTLLLLATDHIKVGQTTNFSLRRTYMLTSYVYGFQKVKDGSLGLT